MRYFLELCLKSVEAAVKDMETEIIVVDNHSSDDSCAMVKCLFPDVKLLENKLNFGFSKGNNLGANIAKGEYICILNPDTMISEDTFKVLLNFAETKVNLGILGCRLIDGKGAFLPESKRNIPKPKVALKKLLGFPKEYYANQINDLGIGEVPILVGAFMLMKKKIFDQVSGFDEDYFMYGEDIDLSYRILKNGYTNFYNGTVTNIHFKGESTLRDRNYAKQFYRAMQVFYKKHFKKNVLFDFIVWIGIRMAYVFREKPKEITANTERYIWVSKKIPDWFEVVSKKPIEVISEINEVKENSEIVLDANMLSYKGIISCISNSKINNKAKFKILPRNSNYIIGSNSTISRGEVIRFEDN